ncbi:signal peptidase I [Sphingomonas sp. SORGH_AS870]|uniref:signal peptidase I n=1 Tax=Sphingomonas sp. SORGH_AS_0870 TaxID=3041801 RepID=UPI002859EE7B|nr:signal peptidase I [Sphingomonas sp. SORGH_AS_0870]MDR6145315.1 signal peptidase I [Sphingomonas sp. SORGH_AS_0870]
MADTSPSSPKSSEAKDTLRFFLKLALFVFILRSFIVTSFVIPSESMLPRLLIGDYLFVTKWNYGYSRWSLPFGVPLLPGRILGRDPARGDVVVFRSPGPDDHDVIKRVIGLPGDTIQVTNGQVILNGRPVPKQRVADFVLPLTPNFGPTECGAAYLDSVGGRSVCRYPRFRETLPGGKSYDVIDQGNLPDRDDTGVYTVPAGRVFLMGDNRDDSADSRFAPPMGMGMIPMDRLEGRAAVTFFSTDGSAEWIKPWTWVTAARWKRIGEGF